LHTVALRSRRARRKPEAQRTSETRNALTLISANPPQNPSNDEASKRLALGLVESRNTGSRWLRLQTEVRQQSSLSLSWPADYASPCTLGLCRAIVNCFPGGS